MITRMPRPRDERPARKLDRSVESHRSDDCRFDIFDRAVRHRIFGSFRRRDPPLFSAKLLVSRHSDGKGNVFFLRGSQKFRIAIGAEHFVPGCPKFGNDWSAMRRNFAAGVSADERKRIAHQIDRRAVEVEIDGTRHEPHPRRDFGLLFEEYFNWMRIPRTGDDEVKARVRADQASQEFHVGRVQLDETHEDAQQKRVQRKLRTNPW